MEPLAPFFDGASTFEKASALQRFRPIKVRRGETVFQRGEKDPTVLWLLEGGVEISRGEVVMALLSGPAMLGEQALIGSSRRTVTVTATSDAKLLRVDATAYQALRADGNLVASRIEREALIQLGRLQRRMADRILQFPPSIGEQPLAWDRKPPGPPRVPSAREVLERCPLLTDMPTQAVVRLAERTAPFTVGRGRGLYRAGEPATMAFLHWKGRLGLMVPIGARRTGSGQARHFLSSPRTGDLHGLVGWLEGCPQAFTCVSATQSDGLAIEAADLAYLLDDVGPAGYAFRILGLRSLSWAVEELHHHYLQLDQARDGYLRSQVAGLYDTLRRNAKS